MRITDLNGKKICILGFGKEGQAMLKALKKHAPNADITLADKNTELQATSYKLQAGPDYLNDLTRFDVIIKSPGIPHQKEFDAVQNRMTSSTRIFFDSIEDSGALIIGVTGSKGKSTTSSLISAILKSGKKDASLIGNIGEPAISHIDEAKPGKIFVMEMSSYQLMDLSVSPHIAVVTSFFPEHLDYHASAPLSTGSSPLERYKNAKKHIAKYQKKNDVIFYHAESEGAREIAMESEGTRIPFSSNECPVAIEDTHLLGNHNRGNIAAAFKVGEHLKIPRDAMIAAIKNFKGLPHRLQSLGVHHDIEWIDDAISTTPESAIAALDALGDRVATMILGGQDRGSDFSELAKRITSSSIKTVILFPGSGPRIREALTAAGVGATIVDADSMEKAVKIAKAETIHPSPHPTLPIVLLSTASPSYNMFKNFEEKGRLFAEYILSK